MTNIVAFGNSHLLAVQRAFDAQPSCYPYGMNFFLLLQHHYNQGFHVEGHDYVWDTPLIENLERAFGTKTVPFVVTSIFGNLWSPRSLFESPTPYDFFTPAFPDPSDNTPREVVPLRLMREQARQGLKGLPPYIAFLRRFTDAKIFEVLPPPPVDFTEKVIRENVFGVDPNDGVRGKPICNRILRLKLWHLYADATREHCRELGVEVVDVPPNTRDADGMLLPELCSGDSVHANNDYGAAILTQLTALCLKS